MSLVCLKNATFVSVANLNEPTEKEALRLAYEKIISEKQAEVIINSKRKIEAFKKSELYKKIIKFRLVIRLQ